MEKSCHLQYSCFFFLLSNFSTGSFAHKRRFDTELSHNRVEGLGPTSRTPAAWHDISTLSLARYMTWEGLVNLSVSKLAVCAIQVVVVILGSQLTLRTK